jgi:hypothetical protein
MKQLILRCVAIAAVVVSSACGETLFSSDFDKTEPNQPPATQQAVGTAAISAPPGGVLVVAPPVTPSGRWVKIERPAGPQISNFQGNLIAKRGAGRYTFTSTLFMPAGAGVTSIQFEPFGQPVADTTAGFLHLDFMPENNVRIDDQDSLRFGKFPRDAPFVVNVDLTIGAASSTAHIVLSGAGTEGGTAGDRTIPTNLNQRALDFGAVRLWVGFPHVAHFNAINIVVKRK